ncbi:type 2 DNA topoisomerase 6 subunit B-like [Nycticebus coucang]|uniref:type 2 DNA topoisomerase 6 subunit B-like n=1 Tax=Nycticebus coucang TaxID=9470 RepID=UPI00234D2272|nr:type 2 DNA topoisomerase 6 subunit B-like [Nycticebus coucang]
MPASLVAGAGPSASLARCWEGKATSSPEGKSGIRDAGKEGQGRGGARGPVSGRGSEEVGADSWVPGRLQTGAAPDLARPALLESAARSTWRPQGRALPGQRRIGRFARAGGAWAAKAESRAPCLLSSAQILQILRYLIIHWKCEIGVSKGALLEGQLMISIEALHSKHQANALHCVTTIAPVGSLYGGFVLKKFLKEIQSVLPRFSAKLSGIPEDSSCSQHTSAVTLFQMIFEVDEKPRTLMTDCLVIKHFLHKITMVHPKIRFNFSLKVNGILSKEIFGVENEPTLNLWNGIALVVNSQHYVRPKFGTTESCCSRIHPVLGHPATLSISDDVIGRDLSGELTLTPAAALCPTPKDFSNQLNRISSVSIFLYGPLGLPLMSSPEQPVTNVFRDTSYFIDWKKYHLHVVPNLDLNLDRDLVLPDMSYQVESSKGAQSQNADTQGHTLLLFLFLDFHNGFPAQQMEILRVHTLLTTHLSTILAESHSVVQDAIQFTVDQVLEQHHQAAKAADTQEFGIKLHKAFHEITQHPFLYHCSCEVKQQTPEKKDSAQSTEDAYEESNLAPHAEICRPEENKRLQSGRLRWVVETTRAPHSARAPRRPEPPAASLIPSGEEAHGKAPAPSRASPGSRLEVTGAGGAARSPHPVTALHPQDALWLQEVSNLSEWLSPSPGP